MSIRHDISMLESCQKMDESPWDLPQNQLFITARHGGVNGCRGRVNCRLGISESANEVLLLTSRLI